MLVKKKKKKKKTVMKQVVSMHQHLNIFFTAIYENPALISSIMTLQESNWKKWNTKSLLCRFYSKANANGASPSTLL